MLKKYLALTILILFPYISEASATTDNAKAFISKVSDDVLKVMETAQLSSEQKEEKLTVLFKTTVDTDWIAKFVLGQYWRSASLEQQNKYKGLHKQYLIKNYVPKFKEYSNQKVKIGAVQDQGDEEYLVETVISSPDGPDVNVDYKVRKQKDGTFKIFDVIAEGVSMITTQRSEFGSILSRKGIDYLIEQLQAKG